MKLIEKTEEGILFSVFVQPRSSKNQIVGRHGDALKIKLTAPPVEGAANKMCVKFIAGELGLPRSSVELVSGQSSRTKRLRVNPAASGKGKMTVAALARRIEDLFS